MGSPLGPVVANIFMCDFEEKWLLNAKVSPLIWNRYVDDTFTMFHNKDSANEFLHYFNSCHSNIKFTIEFEQNNAIRFLDILVTRIQNPGGALPYLGYTGTCRWIGYGFLASLS